MHSAEKMCSLKRESTETKYVAMSFSKIAPFTIHHSPFTQQVMLLTSFFQDLAEGMRFYITPPSTNLFPLVVSLCCYGPQRC